MSNWAVVVAGRRPEGRKALTNTFLPRRSRLNMEDSSNSMPSLGGTRRKMGRPTKLTDEERKANYKAMREREKAKRRQATVEKAKNAASGAMPKRAAKKKEERMELARTDAVKYYSSTAQGAVKEGFAIAATRPTHHSFIPFGYPLHSNNQMATIQQQQMMINAQMAAAAQVQAQFMAQASAAAEAATKMARVATGGVAHSASHSMLPFLLAGISHGGMAMVQSGLQNSRAESDRRDNDSDAESLGNSSGKEDAPPDEPDVPTAAPCKRKREEEEHDEEDNETEDDPSSFKQRVGGDFHSNKGSFDYGADDYEAHAGIDSNTGGTSNDAAIPFADNAYDNVDGHSCPNILLLGMSYPDISSLFGSNADPSPRDVAKAVANGKITQIDARDLVRARALEKFADVHAYW